MLKFYRRDFLYFFKSTYYFGLMPSPASFKKYSNLPHHPLKLTSSLTP